MPRCEVGQRVPQHTNVVEAAKAAGVSFIGYTSAPKAADTDLIIAPEHKATEEVIQASGIPYSIMRNNWYVENYAGTIEGAKHTGEISSATDDGDDLLRGDALQQLVDHERAEVTGGGGNGDLLGHRTSFDG